MHARVPVSIMVRPDAHPVQHNTLYYFVNDDHDHCQYRYLSNRVAGNR